MHGPAGRMAMPRAEPPAVPTVAVIGGGPAGLMAAEQLLAAGVGVDLYDTMPSLGRKLLLAGIGGLNITHAEAKPAFLARYEGDCAPLLPLVDAFDADALRDWVHGLGVETFVGSSGRVFPREMKAAPLLRRWLQRLRQAGLRVHTRHRWLGWAANAGQAPAPGVAADDVAPPRCDDLPPPLRFATPDGERVIRHAGVVLALGGGSWARLGSDGAWQPWLAERGVALAPLRPANCGFEAAWSEVLQGRAGEPLKTVTLTLPWLDRPARRGECVLTRHGLEGSLVYALSAPIRDRILSDGEAVVLLDLLPDRGVERITAELGRPRGSQSRSRHWQRAGLEGVKAALLRELAAPAQLDDAAAMAALAKALPLRLLAPRPIDEAISTAGGVRWAALDDALMLRALPGVFCAGEMLDWEAPTGGYLLTACFASGRMAGKGAAAFVGARLSLS